MKRPILTDKVISMMQSTIPANGYGVPSIPDRFQSYGYEEDDRGQLHLQKPLHPGYSGIKGDTVRYYQFICLYLLIYVCNNCLFDCICMYV